MRLLLTVLIIAVIISSPCLAEDYEVVTIGTGRSAKWSPDGNYLSYISGKGLMLYVVDSGYSRSIVSVDSVRAISEYSYEWLEPDKMIFARSNECHLPSGEVRLCKVFFTIDVHGDYTILFEEDYGVGERKQGTLVKMSNGEIGIKGAGALSMQSLEERLGRGVTDTSAYFIVSNALHPQYLQWGQPMDKDIWLVNYDGSPRKRVTYGRDFTLVELSPDGQLIVAWSLGLTIIDLDGNIVWQHTPGGFGSWFEDSKRLAISVTGEAHDDIVAGDIYILDIFQETATQVTDTPEKVELDPFVSPDMTMIAYWCYKCDGNHLEILYLEGGPQ